MALQLPGHIEIRELRQLRETQQVVHQAGRETRSLDVSEVPTAAFNIENLGGIAEDIGYIRFYRGVSPTVENELRFSTEEPRRKNALSEITEVFFRFAILPSIFHGLPTLAYNDKLSCFDVPHLLSTQAVRRSVVHKQFTLPFQLHGGCSSRDLN